MSLTRHYLYSDIDGTLIAGHGPVSAENLAAIRRFVAEGGRFSIATGRSAALARPFLEGVPLNMPAILFNGAAVYDFAEQRYLHRWCISHALSQRIVHTALAVYPEACAELCDEGPILLVNPDGIMDDYIVKEGQAHRRASLDECGDCFKVLFYGDHERLLPVQRALSGPEFAEVVTCFSAPFYLEVLPAGASKGEALRWICADRGIDLADVAAIGDYENDLAMILTAGLGAAPANAQPAVREAADAVVAPHTEHAVADLIRNYLMR